MTMGGMSGSGGSMNGGMGTPPASRPTTTARSSSGSGGMAANPAVVQSLFNIAARQGGMSGGMSAGMGGQQPTAIGRSGTTPATSAGGMGGMGAMGSNGGNGSRAPIVHTNAGVNPMGNPAAGGTAVFPGGSPGSGAGHGGRGGMGGMGRGGEGGMGGMGRGGEGGSDTTGTTGSQGAGLPPAIGIGDQGVTGGGGGDSGRDYTAEMEAALAPLRAQIEELLKQKKEVGSISGSSDSGIRGKGGYGYNPGGSGNEVGVSSGANGVNGAANLFNNWMNNQESLNRASTAYLMSSGGTRRQDEASSSSSSSAVKDESMKYWNQADSDVTQSALSKTQYDEEKEKRPTYFSNGDRAAGSIFDAWA